MLSRHAVHPGGHTFSSILNGVIVALHMVSLSFPLLLFQLRSLLFRSASCMSQRLVSRGALRSISLVRPHVYPLPDDGTEIHPVFTSVSIKVAPSRRPLFANEPADIRSHRGFCEHLITCRWRRPCPRRPPGDRKNLNAFMGSQPSILHYHAGHVAPAISPAPPHWEGLRSPACSPVKKSLC